MSRFQLSPALSSSVLSVWPVAQACLLFQNPCIAFTLSLLYHNNTIVHFSFGVVAPSLLFSPTSHWGILRSPTSLHPWGVQVAEVLLPAIPAKPHCPSHCLGLHAVLNIFTCFPCLLTLLWLLLLQFCRTLNFSLLFVSSSLHLAFAQASVDIFQSVSHYVSELALKFSLLAYFLCRSFTYVLQALGDGQEHLCIIIWAEESCLCPCPTKIRNNCICAVLRQSQAPCFALGGLGLGSAQQWTCSTWLLGLPSAQTMPVEMQPGSSRKPHRGEPAYNTFESPPASSLCFFLFPLLSITESIFKDWWASAIVRSLAM